MFSYLHCYLPRTWDAQVRAGLIDENAGIRFCQSIDVAPELQFNTLARLDGPLYALVKSMKGPFYIDRLQGGCYLEEYPYDRALVDAYRSLPGDRFWGFQMHEWLSNYSSDLNKLRSNGCPAWTSEAITRTILKAYPFNHLFLESMNAEEMVEFGCPKTYEEFLNVGLRLFERRQAHTGGMLLPCDSAYQADPIELERGAKRLMPEIGAQTTDTRIQLAYARGMTRARGLSFGAYYEPWGGRPFSACCYQRDGENEWGIGNGAEFPFSTAGANGGSSRSMQRRMQLYAYMAGAQFMAEEWGMCNTFYDWRGFELTPYGEVKRDFIAFTHRWPDPGEPVVPAAAVLPDSLPVLEIGAFDRDTYLGYPVEGTLREQLLTARKGLSALFCGGGEMRGDEKKSLVNGALPDGIDIVNEGFLKPEKYDLLVDLTGSDALRKKYPGKVCAPEEAAALLDRFMPCAVKGFGTKQFTRAADGAVYALLLNNSGVERSVDAGERLMPEAEETLTVDTKGGQRLTMLEGDARLEDLGGGRYAVSIPAGGWFFGRLA